MTAEYPPALGTVLARLGSGWVALFLGITTTIRALILHVHTPGPRGQVIPWLDFDLTTAAAG